VPPYPLVQYPRYTAARKKVKITEINGSSVSKRAPGENELLHDEIQQLKRAQYLTHLPLPPYSRFPAEFASILLLAFSLFALVDALSHCLCSESSYL
jgi:hypothetical protein